MVANLAHMAGLTSSSGEARRLIQSGGIRMNDTSIADRKAAAGLSDITQEGVLKISVGRKKHALIRPVCNCSMFEFLPRADARREVARPKPSDGGGAARAAPDASGNRSHAWHR